MNGRNPLAGRHAAGSAIARSGTKPPKRTGPAGLRAPGARTYKANMPITSATLMQSPSRSASNNDYTRQGEQFIRQHAEPFRNAQPSANPRVPRTKDTSAPQSGAGGGFYRPVKGNRISEAQPTSLMSRRQQMPAVGYDADYQYQGLAPAYSGNPLSARNAKNKDSNAGNQPSATAKMKTNRDLFVDAYESYLRHGR